MKGTKVEFTCMTCNQVSVHYCRGMCNPCYQRHLRQRNKSRVAKIQTAKAQTPVQRMKRDDYPYTPPKVGPQFQVDLTQIGRSSGDERQVDLVHKSDSIASEEMFEYLHFCKVVFTDSLAEGDITKGSSCLEEQALKLLRECNYNISRAKLAILFPIEYRLEPYSFDRITEEEVQRRVLQATADLEEIKEEKREDYSKKLSDSLKTRVSKEDLEMMVQVARSIKVEIPPEVSESITAAEEFSSEVSSLLEKKNLKPDEVQVLSDRSEGFAVITPTIAHIQQLAKDCKEWEGKVSTIMKGRPSTKQLQTLASEGSSLQIDLPQLDSIRTMYKKTKKWAESLHSLTKPAKFKKDFTKPTLSQITALLTEAKDLNFTHCEIPGLESQVETVVSWKERLFMWSNDVRYGGNVDVEGVNELMNEYEKLPFGLDTVKGLGNIKEMCQWLIKAETILKKEEKVTTKAIKALISEANQMGLVSGLLKTIETELETANNWKSDAKVILKNADPMLVSDLIDFYHRGMASKIDLEPILRQISVKTTKAQQWQEECERFLSENSSEWDVSRVSRLETDMKELNLASPQVERIFAEVKTAQKWKETAGSFLSSFPKEVPEANDSEILMELLKSAPNCMRESAELSLLSEISTKSTQWARDCATFLNLSAEISPNFSENLKNRAKTHPIDQVLYSDLVNHSNLMQWTVSAEQLLEGNMTESDAKELLSQAELGNFIENPVYSRLANAVAQVESLKSRLEVICDGTVSTEDLVGLYHEAIGIPLKFEAQMYLHHTLLSHFSFRERAKDALQSVSSYTIWQSLVEEGTSLRCKLKELDQLQAIVIPCEEWRQRAALVLSMMPGGQGESEEEGVIVGKRRKMVVEEYQIMRKSQDLGHDLLTCVENAREEDVVYSGNVATTVDPLDGVIWVIRLPSSRQASQLESKRKRILSQRIKELDGGFLEAAGKREGKRPDIKKVICFCHNPEAGETIACLRCRRCFHLSCLNFDTRPQTYICDPCSKRKDDPSDYPQSLPHTLSLPSLHELLTEAKAFPLVLPEVTPLERVIEKGEGWRKRAEEVIGEFDREFPGGAGEEEVARMLQEYEGLPFVIGEKERLDIIYQSLTWLQDAKSTLHDKTSMRTLKRLLKAASEIPLDPRLEFTTLIQALQAKRQAIEFWSETLQRLQSEKATLPEIKRFLEEPEVKKLQFDKFENLKKEAAQTEILAAKVAEALQNKRSDLATLEKLQGDVFKAKVGHEVFQTLAVTIGKMRSWVEEVRVACQDGSPSTDVLKLLLSSYEDISCTHPLARTLEEHMQVFCICKQPDNGEKPMIECDSCKDWFHYDCIGIQVGAAVEDLGEYMCPRCCTAQSLEYRFSLSK